MLVSARERENKTCAGCGGKGPPALWGVVSTLESHNEVLTKLGMEPPPNPAMPLLGIHPKEMETGSQRMSLFHVHRDTLHGSQEAEVAETSADARTGRVGAVCVQLLSVRSGRFCRVQQPGRLQGVTPAKSARPRMTVPHVATSLQNPKQSQVIGRVEKGLPGARGWGDQGEVGQIV